MSRESLNGSTRLPAGCVVISATLLLGGTATVLLSWSAIKIQPKAKPQQAAKQQPVVREQMHPAITRAFEAGRMFGHACRNTGLSRPTERELDVYALKALDEIKPPAGLRGEAVHKFKRGFGWGWSGF